MLTASAVLWALGVVALAVACFLCREEWDPPLDWWDRTVLVVAILLWPLVLPFAIRLRTNPPNDER